MKDPHNKKLAVIKVGGDVLLSSDEREGLAANIKDLNEAGWAIILLHGGGPQVNQLQSIYGLKANKIAGRRITSGEDLKVVKQAIVGEVNVDLVAELVKLGLPAFGCHGASAQLIQATKRPPILVSGGGDQPIDFGQVGDVVSINKNCLQGLLQLGLIPVIATLGISEQGEVYNINADTTVAKIAQVMQADLLVLTTQVGGVFADIQDPKSRIKDINPQRAKQLIADGVITDGMIPKIEEAMALLNKGISAIAIVSGKHSGAFLDVANGGDQFGTRLHP